MFKKILLFCLFFIGLVNLSFAEVQLMPKEIGGKPVSSLQFDVVMESEKQNMTMKMYFKGDKTRMEMDMPGQGKITEILKDNKAYMYMPSQGIAVSMPLDDFKNKMVTPTIPAGVDVKIVGEETIDGRLCAVYQYTYEGKACKAWVDKERKIVLKAQVSQATMYFKNVVINGDMNDSLFEFPAGVQVQDLSGMMKQMQGMMDKYKAQAK
ncbi:MAG: DUF4412 domain-containing protein [Candidatus Omnitrophota bacterium]